MFCPSCGAQNERDAEKCSNCGKPLPRLTPAGELTGISSPPTAGPIPGASFPNPAAPTESMPVSDGPKAGSPGSQYSFSNPSNVYVPFAGFNSQPGYAPYYNYSLPVDRVGVAPAEVGFWPRLGAYVIDNIILSIVSGIVFV